MYKTLKSFIDNYNRTLIWQQYKPHAKKILHHPADLTVYLFKC